MTQSAVTQCSIRESVAAVRVGAVDREGGHSEVEWTPAQSLMEALRDSDLPVLASCGGTASCATCHVLLDPEVVQRLGDRSEDEQELLEETDAFDPRASRLSCQVGWDPALAGITVTLAPEEE